MARADGRTVNKAWRQTAKTGAVLLFWLTAWYLLAAIVDRELLLPGPVAVWNSFCRLIVSDKFWLTALGSLARILLGFSLGMAGGLLLALVMYASPWVGALLSPLVKAVRAAPVASFIILALVWISTERLPVFISFLMVLPVAWANTLSGIRATDRQLLEMARSYSFGPMRTLRRIYLPSLRPYLLAAATTGLGLAWKSGVTAEVIANPRFAIGAELNAAKVTLEMPDMFVWTFVVVALSLLLEALLHKAVGGRK